MRHSPFLSVGLSCCAALCAAASAAACAGDGATTVLEKTVQHGGTAVTLCLSRRPFEQPLLAAGEEKRLPGAIYVLEALQDGRAPARLWQAFQSRSREAGPSALVGFQLHVDEKAGRGVLAYSEDMSVYVDELDLAKPVVPLETQEALRVESLRLPGTDPAPNEIRMADLVGADAPTALTVDPPRVQALAGEAGRWVATIRGASQVRTFVWDEAKGRWVVSKEAP
jgi:hypothetical protein